MGDVKHCPQLIVELLEEVKDLPGDMAEFGVWKGESAELILRKVKDSTVYLFDTFAGMPKEMIDHGIDGKWKCSDFTDTSLSIVRDRLSQFPNACIVPGVFPASVADIKCTIRFAHIDCDLYKSTLSALKWTWERLGDGGVILDDDYGATSCLGAKRAVDEFLVTVNATMEKRGSRAVIRRRI